MTFSEYRPEVDIAGVFAFCVTEVRSVSVANQLNFAVAVYAGREAVAPLLIAQAALVVGLAVNLNNFWCTHTTSFPSISITLSYLQQRHAPFSQS